MRIVLKRWGRVYLSFWRIHSAAGATPARDQNEIKAEFEEIRQQLVSTILGLSFLITRLSLLENSTLGCGARACQRDIAASLCRFWKRGCQEEPDGSGAVFEAQFIV